MRRLRVFLAGRAWLALTWLAARRGARALPEHAARYLYREQTRGLGLRLTEWLRDRLRPSWLRLRTPENNGTGAAEAGDR